ncbi:VUT family protein [Roseovarius faecimaris]|uniref:VUT family protein n=1 Tax=Roseovarius faecimaris TaxID=2494550 RepID=A0A6I6IKL0_9RHOB|nr:VUT family protein [Roseovarius faecimaris]QGX97409.1 VUT family protein [Roseovarius faecimaris]
MNTQTAQRIEGLLYLGMFVACIPLANWMIGNVGTFCVPNGPCVIPVAPGISAPSGVVVIGAALVLRDLVQRRLGLAWAVGAILAGAVLSGFVAPPALVLASVVAFALSEFADLAVYTPLQKRSLLLAVAASGVVGILADSLLFLSLAFGSLDFFWGQVIGKSWALVLALPLVHLLRKRDARLGFQPA